MPSTTGPTSEAANFSPRPWTRADAAPSGARRPSASVREGGRHGPVAVQVQVARSEAAVPCLSDDGVAAFERHEMMLPAAVVGSCLEREEVIIGACRVNALGAVVVGAVQLVAALKG